MLGAALIDGHFLRGLASLQLSDLSAVITDDGHHVVSISSGCIRALVVPFNLLACSV
jgi:hypothetical protein